MISFFFEFSSWEGVVVVTTSVFGSKRKWAGLSPGGSFLASLFVCFLGPFKRPAFLFSQAGGKGPRQVRGPF